MPSLRINDMGPRFDAPQHRAASVQRGFRKASIWAD